MRAMPLQLLTWGTAAAAITSAVWLSSSPDNTLVCSAGFDAIGRAADFELPLPDAPTGAGPAAAPTSSASPLQGSSGSS
jgi:hypothetical protein